MYGTRTDLEFILEEVLFVRELAIEAE